MKKILLLLSAAILLCGVAYGQKQLVLLKKQKVMLRLYPGDELVVKVKGSKRLKRSYVNNLLDNAVVTHRDTIPFDRIERLYFDHHSRLNVIGTTIVFAGVALLIIDQVNNAVVQGNEVSVDDTFTKTTLAVVAAALPMMLIKKKSEKIGRGGKRLMIVTKGSVFYRPDSRGYISPYLDN